jgi:hypothetical protein
VAEHAAPRFVEDEVSQRLVSGDEAALLPDGVARRRRHAADNHVADFAFGMAAYDVDVFGCSHCPSPGKCDPKPCRLSKRSCPLPINLQTAFRAEREPAVVE